MTPVTNNNAAIDLRLIDSHCHLHDTEFFADNREELYQQTIAAGIGMICVGTDERSSRQAVEFAANHDCTWAAVSGCILSGIFPPSKLRHKKRLSVSIPDSLVVFCSDLL